MDQKNLNPESFDQAFYDALSEIFGSEAAAREAAYIVRMKLGLLTKAERELQDRIAQTQCRFAVGKTIALTEETCRLLSQTPKEKKPSPQ